MYYDMTFLPFRRTIVFLDEIHRFSRSHQVFLTLSFTRRFL